MRIAGFTAVALSLGYAAAFSVPSPASSSKNAASALQMGLFDGFLGQGSGKDQLDEQWEAQQEILKTRRKPREERDAYFRKVQEQRMDASQKQKDMWSWQTKKYGKGEDPINEWRKQREKGTISDLDNQYGDPKKVGGIPLPMASFGVGGEFGVGGKFDNGGRFDLRLPYAEQGYVDDDADVMGKMASFFGGNKKKENKPAPTEEKEPEKKKGGWPW